MRTLFIALLATYFSGLQYIEAQNNTAISFEKTVHDFGRIKEEGGKVQYNFKFKNTGKQPIVIKNVESSCGCTTPEWSKTPVLPGKEGFVSAEFDPTDRPASFSKQIMVFNNITPNPIVLEIKGDVIPRTKKLEDVYRYNIGVLRLTTNHVAFARMMNTKKKTQAIEIVNSSNEPIKISSENNLAHIKITASPETLKPNQTGQLLVDYDASKKDAWGYVIDKINLKLNNTVITDFPLTVSASIIEDFSVLSPSELASAPTMDFSNMEYNFGTIKKGEKISYEFKFKNNGKRDLIIREVQSSCGCTAVENKKVIKPGESSAIKVIFNSVGKSNEQNRSITLITNIPGQDAKGQDKYKITLRIKGFVKV